MNKLAILNKDEKSAVIRSGSIVVKAAAPPYSAL
jgi:hypothetical protein